MSKGRIWEDPPFEYQDSYSGRTVRRLTDYLGHSHHFYFTDPGFFNADRSLVFVSQRENASNFFRYDLEDGRITQLTDLSVRQRIYGCVSAATQRLYFWSDNDLTEIDLVSLEERVVWRAEGPLPPMGRPSPTADGRYLVAQLMERPEPRGAAVSYSYSRFVEFFEAKPHTQIVRVDIESGQMEVIHEDRRYMGHLNTSPRRPELMTFCHEGPWARIDQRIWGLNVASGECWPIRDQSDAPAASEQGYCIGHEYWFADGERVGYHGKPRKGRGDHIFGHLRYDNSEPVEVHFNYASGHFHSLDESLMVGDGTNVRGPRPFIQLFRWDEVTQQYVGPKILAMHRSTFNDQHAHPHPHFTPDGRYVLYTSDLTSYSNMYLVEVGDFDDLPDMVDL
jgi:oligogalacturonide lyase